ncbi:hypothetical protein DV495_004723 [Geotrichum candidum]|uniref:Similar to Saccharomyces cerevisiae YNL066W SUN4 Cell wall protein related to glucanases n=1 Tax=Geotrichum candidum TaxID=1173061 RepID=A0A0J9XJW6_GEOCN|nr:hypothetical protein DV495_004723 [Geotrichum candidum]KAF7498765.1 hypothetical protein DV113_003180 [Geotrichum candidum]KAI8134114.1 hypothetical protein DUD61_002246 [Geotrichum candidum]CDO57784.1 similar to Saccharomyces cerevisiae YNL066W SUN4 Cell wall protein related to glucanases [Geotrichum candidum]
MKYALFTALSLGCSALVAAAPHPELKHAHHAHKRDVAYEYVYMTVTVDANGTPVGGSETQAQDDVAAAVEATQAQEDVAAAVQATQAATSSAAKTTSSSTVKTSAAPSSSSTSLAVVVSSSSTVASSTSSAASSTSTSSSSVNSGDISEGAVGSKGGLKNGVSAYSTISDDFEDGTIDCSSFPSGQAGVVSLDYLGFGGWSGIYHSDTSTGGSCTEGSYCSYSCQPGMSKTQWPSNQPSNGVSVGGLLCKGGKLYRSNSNYKNLCVWGVDSAVVVSELSESVAICRTDYPGTENMVVPTIVGAGETAALTCVDQSSYYTWNGKATSAQYYVNNAGVSQADGCVWGDSSSGVGNWAPLNFGAGAVDGISYLSLIPNPNNRKAANFNVKIVAEDGGVVNGECKYENGVYNGSGSDGCTVAVTSGRAKFVLYN